MSTTADRIDTTVAAEHIPDSQRAAAPDALGYDRVVQTRIVRPSVRSDERRKIGYRLDHGHFDHAEPTLAHAITSAGGSKMQKRAASATQTHAQNPRRSGPN
jgi:hypothetical protein